MAKMFQISSLIVLVLIINGISSSDFSVKEKWDRALKAFDHLQSSTYGARCNYTDEVRRLDLLEKILKFSVQSNGNEINKDLFAQVLQFVRDLVINSKTDSPDHSPRFLCDTTNMLRCNNQTNLCDCGPKEPGYSYTVSNNTCRWAQGSECVQEDLVHSFGSSAGCVSGTECTTDKSKKQCNSGNIFKEVFSSLFTINYEDVKCYCQ